MKLAVAVTLAFASALFAQSPSLTHTSPGALAPGQTVSFTLHGANLSGATNLWTVFGAKVLSANATNASATRFQLSVPADAPVGLHALRVASVNGVSSPMLLMVDDLPSLADAGTNITAAKAQPLAWPVAVDGAAVALGFKFYRVTVRAGDRLAIEAVARRLGQVTNFGKIADPLADKALIGAALIGLSILGDLPWWVTVVILVRELGVSLLRLWVIEHGVIPASRGGKLKTVLQTIAITMYLVIVPGLSWWAVASGIVMGLAVALTLVTGVDYLLRALRLRSVAPGTTTDDGAVR